MYKVRIGLDKNKVEDSFVNKTEVFDWVKKNCSRGTIFSLYQYEAGSLSIMDRYTYDGHRVIMENINCDWRQISLAGLMSMSRNFKNKR